MASHSKHRYSNNIPQTLLSRLRHSIQRKYSLPKTPTPTPTTNPPAIKNTKWDTFTYTSPQIRKITNLFKHTNVRIAYKCTNTISHLSKTTNKKRSPPHPTTEVVYTSSHARHATRRMWVRVAGT